VNIEMNNLLNNIELPVGDMVLNVENETQNESVKTNEIVKVDFENFLEQI
jgi:hypothetical protein